MKPSQLWKGVILAAVAAIAGCSGSEPVAARRVESTEAAEVPIQPKLTESIEDDSTLKFESVEAEMAYWQSRAITEVKKRFEKLTPAEIQKIFSELKPEEQASVQRVQSWLPHKRIMEMGNPAQDVAIITGFPTQFDVDLAMQRMLEYADDSGAAVLMKNMGVTKPKAMVWFRMEFGQISPEAQSMIWGIHQKLKEGGLAKLSPSELGLLQTRPGLFPRLP